MIEHLEAALRHQNEHGLDFVLGEIAAGRARLWTGERSVIVTTYNETDAKRWVCMWLAGGDWDEIDEMRQDIEADAKARGYDYVNMAGRKGFSRKLAKSGYNVIATIVEKRL